MRPDHSREPDPRYWLDLARRAALARIGLHFVDDDAAFRCACKSKRLAAFAERYTLDAGSALLTGETGRGKTISVARALRRLIHTATRTSDPVLGARWTTAAEIVGARRRHRLGDGDAPEIRSAAAALVLVIDELGFEADDGALFELLDRRYSAGLPTLITTGRPLGELREKYGAAAVRRMHEPRGLIVEAWP